LVFALAVSLGIHLLVLWQQAPRPLADVAAASAALTARLNPSIQVTDEPLSQGVEKARSRSSVITRADDAQAETPVPETVSMPAAPAQDVRSEAARATNSSTPVTGSPTPAMSQDALTGYRLALALQARRLQRYPASARSEGVTGQVDVRLVVGADGRPKEAAIARSSRQEVLDRAALAIIDASAARVIVPDALRGHAFSVVVPMVFSLTDG
jgi:protein TonB